MKKIPLTKQKHKEKLNNQNKMKLKYKNSKKKEIKMNKKIYCKIKNGKNI